MRDKKEDKKEKRKSTNLGASVYSATKQPSEDEVTHIPFTYTIPISQIYGSTHYMLALPTITSQLPLLYIYLDSCI